MLTAVLPLLLAIQATGDAPAGRTAAQASAAAGIAAANGGCLAQATGAITIGPESAADRHAAFYAGGNVSQGAPQPAVDALGAAATGLISDAAFGHRQVGQDHVVLAIGGAFPLCRVLIASPQRQLDDGEEIQEAALASGLWRFANSLPNDGTVKRRVYAHRAANGQAYLLFTATGTLPQSDVRTLMMVGPAPTGYPLPEGL